MLLNFFHLSAQNQEENATGANETLSMFIYGSFLAPFGEEILFRGFLLQNFKRYGVRFAIIFQPFYLASTMVTSFRHPSPSF